MKKIYVTKPFLPPIDEYVEYLEKIWEKKILTNNGPLHSEFESKLAEYLGVKYISLVNNATSGLMIALEALGLKNEIITTPFSFIATSHSIKWNRLKPVFVDTDKLTGNLLPENVEEAVTNKTSGILASHNFYPYFYDPLTRSIEAITKQYEGDFNTIYFRVNRENLVLLKESIPIKLFGKYY